MKFMISWALHTDTREDTLAYFSQMTPEDDREMLGDTITLVGRWHDLVSGAGVAILESDDLSAVNNFCLNWTNVCDINITPVLSDEEARAVGLARS